MKQVLILFSILLTLVTPIAAQQNWAAIPCSKIRQIDAINSMFIDSLHNEIIFNSTSGYSICTTTYKGLFAYNENGFHDLDKGIETHDGLNLATNGSIVKGCIRFEDKTLFGGGFLSVGTNTLYAKSIALWNGSTWSNFPTPVFDNTPNWNTGGGFQGFLKWNSKLWMYGGFNSIGNTVTTNLTAYDGGTYTAVPAIPVTNNSPITKLIGYKNKLIATGNFDNSPSATMWRLAQYDGTNWAPVGTGVLGSIGGVWDMTVFQDTLYIAGSFSKSAGNAANYIMKWDGTQLHDAGFSNNYCGFGPVIRLLPFRNRLYAFGAFTCAAGQKAFGVAFYENGIWTAPNDSIDDAITGAEVYNNEIYICGFFKSINGDTTKRKFAKLMCPDFDAASGCVSGLKERSNTLNVKVFPNPSTNKINVEFEQGVSIDRLSISNTLGQEVYSFLEPEPKLEIDVSYLSGGIYFLKVASKYGQGVSKIVKE